MTWHIEFAATSKAKAIEALRHPRVTQARGLPIAVREEIIVLIKSLSESDPRAFVLVKTHGSIPGPNSTAHANKNIEVSLIPSYIVPGIPEDEPDGECEAGVAHWDAPR